MTPFDGPELRAWATQQIEQAATRTDWSKLPASFETDAVTQTFRTLKPHFNKKAIRSRINASNATAFAELREALGI